MLRGKITAVTILAITSCILPCFAADAPESLRGRMNSDHDHQIANSMDFLLTLNLSKSQAREIMAYHEDALDILVDYYVKLSDIQPQEIEAYQAFLEEDRLNQGFSKDVEKKTARIHHEAIKSREQCNIELNKIAEKVQKCLTPQQKRLARDYKPTRQALNRHFATEKDRKKATRRQKRRSKYPNQHRQQDTEIQRAQQELHKINSWVHHGKNNIAEFLLTPAASSSLHEVADRKPSRTVTNAQKVWYNGTKDYPIAQFKFNQKQLRAIQSEINNWNLTNGMHFSPEQIESLVDITRRMKYVEKMQRESRPRDKMPVHQFHATLVSFERQAESVLNPGQLEVLVTYSPCLIPPKNLKNPVRVGQANDNSLVSRWLDKARTAENEKHLAKMIDWAIEKEIDHNGPLDQYQEAERRRILSQTAERAANLSDVEYALEKEDLVAIAAPPDRKQDLKEKIDQLKRERLIPGRTKQFILNEDFANVLMYRYDQLARGEVRDGIVITGNK